MGDSMCDTNFLKNPETDLGSMPEPDLSQSLRIITEESLPRRGRPRRDAPAGLSGGGAASSAETLENRLQNTGAHAGDADTSIIN